MGNEQQTSAAEAPPPVVIRTREGPRPAGRTAERLFGVILSAPADDLTVVAEAVDPRTGLRIPAAGDAHPDDAEMIARPPWICPVGLRAKGGAMLAAKSCFYNVRVRYARRES